MLMRGLLAFCARVRPGPSLTAILQILTAADGSDAPIHQGYGGEYGQPALVL